MKSQIDRSSNSLAPSCPLFYVSFDGALPDEALH